MVWQAARVAQHACHVHKVEGHECQIAACERAVIAGTFAAFGFIAVGGTGTGFANPAAIGLGRDRIAYMLKGVEHGLGYMLDAILIAGDDGPANFAIVDILVFRVALAGMGVEPFR